MYLRSISYHITLPPLHIIPALHIEENQTTTLIIWIS